MAINFHTKQGITGLELLWCQYPLPFPLGSECHLVAMQTSFGRVMVTKDWFDNNVVNDVDGPVQWQTLLTLLEEQVKSGVQAYAQHLFDPDDV